MEKIKKITKKDDAFSWLLSDKRNGCEINCLSDMVRQLIKEHNKLVEELHGKVFKNFKVNGSIWYKRSSVPLHERVKE